jgi:hypothetical protein
VNEHRAQPTHFAVHTVEAVYPINFGHESPRMRIIHVRSPYFPRKEPTSPRGIPRGDYHRFRT